MKIIKPITISSSNLESGIEIDAQTNLCLWSEELDGGVWTFSNMTATSGQTLGPDGTAISNKLEKDAVGTSYVSQTITGLSNGVTYGFAIKVKAGDYTTVKLTLSGVFADTSYTFDTSAGTETFTGDPSYSGYVEWREGWYLIWLFQETSSAGSGIIRIYIESTYAVDAELYVSQCQFYLGETLQEYIKSEGTAGESTPDYTEYAALTEYAENDYAYYGQIVYQSLKAANTGNRPDLNLTGADPWWFEVGYLNAWQMFDPYLSTKTTADVHTAAPSMIPIVFSDTEINSIALFGLEGTEVRIELTSALNEILDQTTIPLLTWLSECYDWWDYFFGDDSINKSEIVYYFDRLTYTEKIRILIINQGAAAKCSHCVFGRGREIGKTMWRPEVGVLDYSKKDTDSFGRTYLAPGVTARLVRADILVETGMVDTTNAILASMVGVGSVYDFNEPATDFSSLIVFGFPYDTGTVLHGPTYNICRLEVQGLT